MNRLNLLAVQVTDENVRNRIRVSSPAIVWLQKVNGKTRIAGKKGRKVRGERRKGNEHNSLCERFAECDNGG